MKTEQKNIYGDFSQRLIDLMRTKGCVSNRATGINIRKLAEITEASEQICRRYVRGNALPDYEKILKISNFFQISPGWLLFGELSCYNSKNKIVHVEEELLHYILQKSHLLYQLESRNSDDFPDFVLELIKDISSIDASKESLKKIIDLAVTSICTFEEKKNKKVV